MNFKVEHSQEKRKPSESYRYIISYEGKDFAVLSHDFRGEVTGIKVIKSGYCELPPFASCADFLTGGGPEPLGLSSMAIKYLEKLLKEKET